jgi:hypothetical protein
MDSACKFDAIHCNLVSSPVSLAGADFTARMPTGGGSPLEGSTAGLLGLRSTETRYRIAGLLNIMSAGMSPT